VLVKRARESERHVLLTALVFGLYGGRDPGPTVEPRFRHRDRPDLVALDADGEPVFWAECGETSRQKLAALLLGFPGTHLLVAKQVPRLDRSGALLGELAAGVAQRAPVELLDFPAGAEACLGPDGGIRVSRGDVAAVSILPRVWANDRRCRGSRRGAR